MNIKAFGECVYSINKLYEVSTLSRPKLDMASSILKGLVTNDGIYR